MFQNKITDPIDILVELTADGVEKYSKDILNEYYLQKWVVEKIKGEMPEEIRG